jgi:hypothetical protein
MSLAQWQDIVEALAAEGPHNPLLVAFTRGPGSGTWGADPLQSFALDPGGGRVRGHVEVEQTAAIVDDQEEDVEGPRA